jgi:hypothetical protein
MNDRKRPPGGARAANNPDGGRTWSRWYRICLSTLVRRRQKTHLPPETASDAIGNLGVEPAATDNGGAEFATTSGSPYRDYIARAPEGGVALPISPKLGHPEHHDYRLVTFDEADRLVNRDCAECSDMPIPAYVARKAG